MADTHTPPQRHANMAAIRGKDTKPEMLVRRYLWGHGFRYRLNHPRLPGKPDIVLRKYRTCIFVNGCFWHGHEGCQYYTIPKTNTEFWVDKVKRNKERDLKVQHELATILEENFIKDEDGKWRKPDAEKAADLKILRGKKLMKEFNLYLEQASKPKAKRMKDTRLEVLRYGFKECYKQKNYQAIVTVGDHIQKSLLQEDEVLLQYYDIASMRV